MVNGPKKWRDHTMSKIPCALTIAGTDPSGGAGIQADLKTFQELKSYGMSIITSVVAQNTTGVQAVHHLPLEMIEQQLESVLSDVPVHALKTGMIAHIDMMKVIARKISNLDIPFIMDPVMVATSGDRKSTRLNSSHVAISYAVFCLKKKTHNKKR